VATAMAGTELADSACFDFHKLGFAPYPGSVFATRHRQEFRGVFGDDRDEDVWLPYGRNFRLHHSLEHSRSGAPIVAAWVAMQTLGRNGFRAYLGHMHELTARLREAIRAPDLTVLNPDSPSLATMVVPRLPGAQHTGPGQDHYTELLFRHVAGLDGGVPRPLAIGYVPGYAPTGGGRSVAALRLFLVNPFLDDKHVDGFAAQLVDLKREFDDLHSGGRTRSLTVRLDHTPR
jgi:L-2,4-diaminobutyrate decarboxylase